MKKKGVKLERAGQPATILYQKMPAGMILIKGFENFLTVDEMEKKYGDVVSDMYMNYPRHMNRMFRSDGQEYIHISNRSEGMPLAVFKNNALFTEKEFSKIVAEIKTCGELLHDVIQSQSNEIRKIKI